MLVLLVSLLTPPASAEIDPGCFVLIQDDKVVGSVYVPKHESDEKYVEYWFLYEDYTFLNTRLENNFALKSDGATGDFDEWSKKLFEAHPDGKLMVSVAVETTAPAR